MKRYDLEKYVSKHGQTKTAERAGLTQGAIWQMLQGGRQIFVTEIDDDTVELEEVKPIKRTSAA
tara:strand:- start:194 stop:385 length:192 start_codon:yes stop_codon:yes gene_type:complete